MFDALARYRAKQAAGLVDSEVNFNRNAGTGIPEVKKKPTTFFEMVLAIIWFCLEQIFGSIVIGGSLVKESVPSCVYILLAMVYMLKSVGQDQASVVQKMIIGGIITALSIIVIGAKIAFTVLMQKWSSPSEDFPIGKIIPGEDRDTFYKTFGMIFVFDNGKTTDGFVHGIETFVPDLMALVGGALLVWYARSHLKQIKG